MGTRMKAFLPGLWLFVTCGLVLAIAFGVFGCTSAYVDGVGQMRDANSNPIYPPLSYEPVEPSGKDSNGNELP